MVASRPLSHGLAGRSAPRSRDSEARLSPSLPPSWVRSPYRELSTVQVTLHRRETSLSSVVLQESAVGTSARSSWAMSSVQGQDRQLASPPSCRNADCRNRVGAVRDTFSHLVADPRRPRHARLPSSQGSQTQQYALPSTRSPDACPIALICYAVAY